MQTRIYSRVSLEKLPIKTSVAGSSRPVKSKSTYHQEDISKSRSQLERKNKEQMNKLTPNTREYQTRKYIRKGLSPAGASCARPGFATRTLDALSNDDRAGLAAAPPHKPPHYAPGTAPCAQESTPAAENGRGEKDSKAATHTTKRSSTQTDGNTCFERPYYAAWRDTRRGSNPGPPACAKSKMWGRSPAGEGRKKREKKGKKEKKN
ncbi:hypothetical protein K525DRAFT_251289 [Schizophyllum commune Loenen D]|nr:hypothetical protein K525DRAFT_251289 [Schizophyllum commune Loenen D]